MPLSDADLLRAAIESTGAVVRLGRGAGKPSHTEFARIHKFAPRSVRRWVGEGDRLVLFRERDRETLREIVAKAAGKRG